MIVKHYFICFIIEILLDFTFLLHVHVHCLLLHWTIYLCWYMLSVHYEPALFLHYAYAICVMLMPWTVAGWHCHARDSYIFNRVYDIDNVISLQLPCLYVRISLIIEIMLDFTSLLHVHVHYLLMHCIIYLCWAVECSLWTCLIFA